MTPTVKNIIAIVCGWFIGSLVNMGLIEAGHTLIPIEGLDPNAHLIKGVVCGYRIEDIGDEFKLYRQCRYLDKLVDELAKGQAMEKILRK